MEPLGFLLLGLVPFLDDVFDIVGEMLGCVESVFDKWRASVLLCLLVASVLLFTGRIEVVICIGIFVVEDEPGIREHI